MATSELLDQLREMLGERNRAQRLEKAADDFVAGVFSFMTQEGRNLQAALDTASAWLEHQLADEAVTEEAKAFNREAMTLAADEARGTLEHARKLIAADDTGNSEPLSVEEVEAQMAAFSEGRVDESHRGHGCGLDPEDQLSLGFDGAEG